MKQLSRILYLIFFYLFLYIPIGVVIFLSFNDTRYSLVWHTFTWKWYLELSRDPGLVQVAINSLTVGVIAATMATVLGAVAALGLFRYRFFGKSAVSGLLFIMIVIPDIVVAIALLLLFRILHFNPGFWTLLLAHITFCIPFVFVTANTRLSDFNRTIIEAARDLGAGEYRIFLRILVPLILPALVAGWLLSFTLSLDDVIISSFVTGPGFEILPLKIYSMVKIGVSPEVNALSSILFIVTLLVVLVCHSLTRRNRAGST